MVVCKYYQQGNCRFGDRCRFEHPGKSGFSNYNTNNAYKWYGSGFRSDEGTKGGVTFRDTFSTANRFETLGQQNDRQSRLKVAPGLSGCTPQEILTTISADMETWQQSQMWQFSCYTYFREGACFPGLEDLCPEEMRLEAYEAQKSGSIQAYVQKMKDLVNKYRQMRSELARPGMQVKQKLIQFIEDDRKRLERGVPALSSSTSVSGFGSGSGNLFSSSQQSSSLFLTSSPSGGNPFGNSQSAGNLFGNTPPSGNPFGNSQSAGNIFGNSPSSGNVFGSRQSAGNIFGNSQSTGNLFGKSQSAGSLFGNSGQQSGFVNLQGKSITGGAQSSFGAGQTSGGLFSTSSGGSFTFGQQSPTAATGLSAAQASGTSASQSAVAPGNQVSSVHTPLSDLTAEERQQFEATHFTAGKLPTRPPPKELC